MRARNLKPGILKNEVLGAADPLYTLLFQGLWMLADREGRLEDRPLRIKAEVFAYRNLDCDCALQWLADNGFILRYVVSGKKFIQIINFAKHQNPHSREIASSIPAPEAASEKARSRRVRGTTKAVPKHGLGCDATQPNPCPARLIPDSPFSDSGFLTPDSPSLGQPPEGAHAPRETPTEFLDFKLAYPNRLGDQGWRSALRCWNARIAEGHSPAEMVAGAKRYAAHIDAIDRTGTEYVKQAKTFLGPDRHFLEPWPLPASKAERQQDRNVSASVAWLEQQEAGDAA